MNKQAFLDALYHHLKALPKAERQQHIDYYAEMIDDRMEEGFDEESAVGALGNTADIAAQIIGEAPQKTSKKYSVWVILLVVLGSPLWISLLLAAASVIISIYISIWAVIISLYATAVALGISSIVVFLMPLLYIPTGNVAGACLVLGAAMVLTGITILLFVSLKPVTKGTVWLTKKSFVWLKRLFVGKEAAQ